MEGQVYSYELAAPFLNIFDASLEPSVIMHADTNLLSQLYLSSFCHSSRSRLLGIF